jgi:hypothetical protein
MFRDGTPGVPVIAKVIRGTDARRLLYYLYGPGRGPQSTTRLHSRHVAEGRPSTARTATCRKISTVNHGQTILSPPTDSGNRALTCYDAWAILGLNQ